MGADPHEGWCSSLPKAVIFTPPCLPGAFTLHWGYQFKFNNMPNSEVQYPISQISQMPGSTEVLDRSTGLLTECTPKLCPLATYDSNVLNDQGYPMLVSFERSLSGLKSKSAASAMYPIDC